MLSAPGSPMSSAHCCSLRQPDSGSLPSASSAFQPWVASLSKSGWCRRVSGGAAAKPALRERRIGPSSIMMRLLLVRFRSHAAGFDRLAKSEHRNRRVAREIEVVGDDRAEPARRLRIVPRAIQCDHPRAEPEGFLDVVRDHDHGHAVLPPQRRDQRMHLGARARIERAEGLAGQEDAWLAGEGRSWPRIRRRNVLLPAPDGPTTDRKVPEAISRLMRSSTIWSPYSTHTSRTEIALISAVPRHRPRGRRGAPAWRAQSPARRRGA